MNNSDRSILVAGATGRQGGAVIRRLLKNKVNVRALSRTPDSISSLQLEAMGVRVVKGDMADPESLAQAMNDCYGVFSVQNYFEYGGEKEIQYGKNMADAARQSHISHFIYSSVCNADSQTGVPHFETKHIIEQYIHKIGIPATIFRPVKFMENYFILQVFRGILAGKLFDSIIPAKKHQMIAVDDIGAYVQEAFTNSQNYLGQVIEIAGEELSNVEVAKMMSEVLGMKVKFKRLPLLVARLIMDKEMYLMFRWFNRNGFTADIEGNKRKFPGIHLTTLHQWLLDEGWNRWNKKGSI